MKKLCNFVGIDTSNYTTSVSLFNSDTGSLKNIKKLLPVKDGACGLRQSEAFFLHGQVLPNLLRELFNDEKKNITAIGVSVTPCYEDGSYMPCFLLGYSVARSISYALNVNCSEFSHQAGHIAAVLFGAGRLDLLKKNFIAFHVSGGTSEVLLVTPDVNKVIKTKTIARSLDINAGQLIDRVGIRLGTKFPAGAELEKMAVKSQAKFDIKPSVKGLNFCLSGVQNICEKMINENRKKEDVALFCIQYIEKTIEFVCKRVLNELGDMPVVFVGGVMSNCIIRKNFETKFNGIFAEPKFSSDNACGVAVLASMVDR